MSCGISPHGPRVLVLSSSGSLALLPHGMWDLSTLTRDRTCVPCIARWILNHQITREVPNISLGVEPALPKLPGNSGPLGVALNQRPMAGVGGSIPQLSHLCCGVTLISQGSPCKTELQLPAVKI